MSKKGTQSAEVGTLAPGFEKSDTGPNPKPNLFRGKNIVNISTLNRITEITACAVEHNIDIICVQEHKYYLSEIELKCHDTYYEWALVLAYAWKNFTIGSPHTLRLRKSIERTIFYVNPYTTIVPWYSPTDACDETSLRLVGDMNAQLGKDENNEFCLHNLPNRNADYQADRSLEKSLVCLNTKF